MVYDKTGKGRQKAMKKWTRINYQPCMPLGEAYTRITESETHISLSKAAACEGAVLLKNHHEILPLQKGQKIAVFGTAQIDYVKGGGGSGDVTVSYVRNIYEGLKMKGDQVQVFDELSLFYEKYVREQYQKGEKNGALTETKVQEELMKRAKIEEMNKILMTIEKEYVKKKEIEQSQKNN